MLPPKVMSPGPYHSQRSWRTGTRGRAIILRHSLRKEMAEDIAKPKEVNQKKFKANTRVGIRFLAEKLPKQ